MTDRCKWDREREQYLRDGEPCRTDDYGDPTHHCTARRTCANHVGAGELTCARCIGRTRQDIRAIRELDGLMLPLALDSGVNSDAASLAGPAADYETWSARRNITRDAIQRLLPWTHWPKAYEALLEDEDAHHPYNVLTRWEFMLREDYDQPRTTPTSVTEAADYLERTLGRLAQDDEQDWPLFAREIRRCRRHLEAVLRNSQTPERGAPCPLCATPAPKLNLKRGHWCDAEDCDRIHWPQDPDRYVCPRDREHWWTDEDYRKWVADVYEAQQAEVGA